MKKSQRTRKKKKEEREMISHKGEAGKTQNPEARRRTPFRNSPSNRTRRIKRKRRGYRG